MRTTSVQNQSNIQRTTNTEKPSQKSGVSGDISSTKNSSISHPNVTTDKKTVHIKDVKQLNSKITDNVNKILDQLKSDQGGVFGLQNNDLKNISLQLHTLKTNVASYQDKIQTSSYKHSPKKMDSLNDMNKTIDKATQKIKSKMDNLSQKDAYSNNKQTRTLDEKVQQDTQRKQDYSIDGYK